MKQRFSNLTAKTLIARLKKAAWTRAQFAHLVDITVREMTGYTDGSHDKRIPGWVEIVLEVVERYPGELRGWKPAGIDGTAFVDRLRAAGWNRSDFCRLTGAPLRGIQKLSEADHEGRPVPVWIELSLILIERHSMELLARPEVQTPVRKTPARKEAWKRVEVEKWEALDRQIPKRVRGELRTHAR